MIAKVVARAGRGAMRDGSPWIPCETLAAIHVAADSMLQHSLNMDAACVHVQPTSRYGPP